MEQEHTSNMATQNPNDLTITGTNQSVNQAQGNPAGTTGTNAAPTPPTTPTTNPPVSTAQPNPATVNATPVTNPTAPNSQQVQDALNNPKAKALATPSANPIQQGYQNAQTGGTPPPQDAGSARTAVQSLTPPPIPDTTHIDTALNNDPGYQQLIADKKEYNNTVNQQGTLLTQYQSMLDKAGIPALDTQLLNANKIIQGTEQDIRNEVQAVNGFATNSQVLALSAARNKTLIQNYNNLLDTKKMAEDHVNTMIGLAKEDRATALSNITEKLNIDKQLADYAQKFQTNAQEGYKNVINAVGYSGFVNSLLNSDPTGASIALAEKTLGFQPGQLQTVATAEKSASNLKVIQESGATSPYVVNANGEVQDTATGYAYTSKEDFQAKTGKSLEQAVASGAIQKLPENVKTATEKAQLQKAQTDAKYADQNAQLGLAEKKANIVQSEASAGASSASAAKSRYELGFEQAHGGMTPTEVQAQQKAVDDYTQKINDDAAGYIEKMGTKKITWKDAFDAMKASHQDLSTQAIDNLLQSENYRP